ncbi:hypothetical protein LGQ02_16680 [Bacillus shivajii]|uniref:hypothetical protein n=1 Tax=Bacillus shivajii TaxID=1983719 RepID=UPI001CF99D78|nr:hypothetical protein [Bacillus shivajii]UCZ52456.1 hypothetical protein LGQ02_16680 [Bacillus shivajii]
MKRLLFTMFMVISISLVVSGCGAEEESEFSNYQPNDYSFALVDTNNNEVEVMTENEKAIYLYFTGVD